MTTATREPLGARINKAQLVPVLVLAAFTMLVLAAGGIWLTRETGRIASIWVANAALAALILASPRDRHVAILGAAFVGNVAANILAGDSPAVALGLSACNSLEIFAVTALIMRVQPQVDFKSLHDLSVFAVIAGLVAPFISAMVASTFLHYLNGAPFLSVLVNWYASDALGLLVFLPLIATVLDDRTAEHDMREAFDLRIMALLVLHTTVTVVVFWQDTLPLLFLVMLPLLVVAARSGTPGAVVANLIVTVIAITGTLFETGPIQLVDAPLSMRMVLLQAFLAACVFISLMVSAYLAERRRLEAGLRAAIEQSERANAAKSTFLSTVSHELRTPLTSIRGSLGLVNAGVAGDLPPKAMNLVRIAHANSERLVRLINDILDMEKIESGKMTFDVRLHRLRDVVESALEVASNYQPERHVRVVLIDDAPRVNVMADADRLNQVLTNLLSNAIKFSPDDGIVQLQLVRSGDVVRISVKDQGAGIPEKFRARIFGKFEQADASSTRERGGTGLGLSITRALVEHMSGTIGFVSDDGVGTTFTVTLPVANAHPMRDDGPARVLICVQDSDVASILTKRLLDFSYVTDQAPDIASASLLLQQRRYVALTLDMDAMGEAGLDLFTRMRESTLNAGIPVIALSAEPDATRKMVNGSAVGIMDFLAKPPDPDRLAESVRRLVVNASGNRPRVLHVEDDSDVLRVIATGLGGQVAMTFARSLAEARECLARERFDMVILDVSLPDGSGLDLLAELDKDCAVVIFSAQEVDGPLPRPVSSALIKTRKSEVDVARTVRDLLADRLQASA